MKNFTLIIILFLSISFFSQEKEKLSKLELGNYIFTSSFQTDSVTDFNGVEISKEIRIHKQGRKFKIINTKKDFVIIQYWKWNNKNVDSLKTIKSEKVILNEKFYKNTKGELQYFVINNKDFNRIATKFYNRNLPVTAGVYSVPFKLRLNDFDFEQDLNIGVNIGFPFRTKRTLEKSWILEPNFGIGISKVNLNEKNTNGTVKTVRTANAFTFSGGLLIRFSEKINFGVFLGKDLLGKSDSDTNWQYDKKFWLGLGLNISLNNPKEKAEEKGKN